MPERMLRLHQTGKGPQEKNGTLPLTRGKAHLSGENEPTLSRRVGESSKKGREALREKTDLILLYEKLLHRGKKGEKQNRVSPICHEKGDIGAYEV